MAGQRFSSGQVSEWGKFTGVSGPKHFSPPSTGVGAPGVSSGYMPTSTFGWTINWIRYEPIFVSTPITITSVSLQCTATAGASNIRVSIYDSNGTNGYPGGLIATLGTVDTGTTGTKTISSLNQVLTVGSYWVATQADAGNATMRTFALGSLRHTNSNMGGTSLIEMYATITYGASAPSTATTPTNFTFTGADPYRHLCLFTWTVQ